MDEQKIDTSEEEIIDQEPDEVAPPTDEELAGDTTEGDADPIQAQIEEYKAMLQRERAEFQNFKKRTKKEMDDLRLKISGDVLAKILPVIDDFERALTTIPAEEKGNEWLTGIEMIQRKLQTIVEGESIEAIDPLGEPFDPNFHEAIGTDDPTDDIPSDHITLVLQKGYKIGDRVLRPALVKVAN